MKDIPQIKPDDPRAEEKARDILRILCSVLHPSNGSIWEVIEEYDGGELAAAFTGEGETIIEAINDAVRRDWKNLTIDQQSRIRSILEA